MTLPIILVTASGLAREAVAAARAQGLYDVVGYVDDDAAQLGRVYEGIHVVGGLDAVREHPETQLVLCAGKGDVRQALARRLTDLGVDESRYGTVIHPSVEIPDSCRIGAGSVVLAGCVLTTSIRVGQHVVVMPGAV